MRARSLFFVGSFALAGAAFAVQACSSSEEAKTTAAAVDSGSDAEPVDSSPPKEAAAPEQDSATCDLSDDVTKKIPDASIADGASTTGICLGCTDDKCAKEVTACNHDCTCQSVAEEALGCYLQNSGKSQQEIIKACAGPFLGLDSNTQTLVLNLVGCLNKSCKTECAVPQDAGTDADAAQ